MPSADNRTDRRDRGLLLFLSVLWGGSFFFNGVILRELPPLTLVLLRVLLGALILLPLLRARKIEFPRGLAGCAPFAAMGLFNNALPFSLIVFGQTYIPSGLASILNATTPLFEVVVMAAAGEERLQARRVAGVVVGLIGVAILFTTEFGVLDAVATGIATVARMWALRTHPCGIPAAKTPARSGPARATTTPTARSRGPREDRPLARAARHRDKAHRNATTPLTVAANASPEGRSTEHTVPYQKDLLRTHAVPIDMVVVNLYPFKETIAKPDVTPEKARGNIDIGGPCMIRASAKNFLRPPRRQKFLWFCPTPITMTHS